MLSELFLLLVLFPTQNTCIGKDGTISHLKYNKNKKDDFLIALNKRNEETGLFLHF